MKTTPNPSAKNLLNLPYVGSVYSPKMYPHKEVKYKIINITMTWLQFDKPLITTKKRAA